MALTSPVDARDERAAHQDRRRGLVDVLALARRVKSAAAGLDENRRRVALHALLVLERLAAWHVNGHLAHARETKPGPPVHANAVLHPQALATRSQVHIPLVNGVADVEDDLLQRRMNLTVRSRRHVVDLLVEDDDVIGLGNGRRHDQIARAVVNAPVVGRLPVVGEVVFRTAAVGIVGHAFGEGTITDCGECRNNRKRTHRIHLTLLLFSPPATKRESSKNVVMLSKTAYCVNAIKLGSEQKA